jgi:hypothetical protein
MAEFGETCGGRDGPVANAGLPQFSDMAQHKSGRDEPAPVAGALRRRPFAGVAGVGGAAGNTAATAQIAVPRTVQLLCESNADRGKSLGEIIEKSPGNRKTASYSAALQA